MKAEVGTYSTAGGIPSSMVSDSSTLCGEAECLSDERSLPYPATEHRKTSRSCDQAPIRHHRGTARLERGPMSTSTKHAWAMAMHASGQMVGSKGVDGDQHARPCPQITARISSLRTVSGHGRPRSRQITAGGISSEAHETARVPYFSRRKPSRKDAYACSPGPEGRASFPDVEVVVALRKSTDRKRPSRA